MQDINKMEKGSAVLFHACAHNPTGCDLTLD
jgi:aspartate aminotransferase